VTVEIWGFYGSEYSSQGLLGCDVMCVVVGYQFSEVCAIYISLKLEAAWTSEMLIYNTHGITTQKKTST